MFKLRRGPGAGPARRSRAGLLLLCLLAVLGWGGAPGRAASTGNAGLVVAYGPGQVTTYCFSVPAQGVSGLELLQRTGLALRLDVVSLGAEICAISGTGCLDPGQPCFCQCQGTPCVFWHYAQWRDGRWVATTLGASRTLVRPGDIDGWNWGSTSAPPPPTGNALCALQAVPTATSQPASPTPAPPALPPPPPSVTPLPPPTATPRPASPPATPRLPPPTTTPRPPPPTTTPRPPVVSRTPVPRTTTPPTVRSAESAPPAPATVPATATAPPPPGPPSPPVAGDTATSGPAPAAAAPATATPVPQPTDTRVAAPSATATAEIVVFPTPALAHPQADGPPASYWVLGLLVLGLLGLVGWARRGRSGDD